MSNRVDPGLTALDGETLLHMFVAAAASLESQTEAINALNVFPVPDGDTGTNMLLTMRSAVEEASSAQALHAGEALASLSRGSLMGARGNSGVILSQIIRGFRQAAHEKERLDGLDFVAGFREAATYAYQSVSEPVEGTLLTVAREVAEAMEATSWGPQSRPSDVLAASSEAARAAVARTPYQLAVLRENGVVDAGGLGYAVILEAFAAYARGGGDVTPIAAIAERRAPEAKDLHLPSHASYGFCTEYLVEHVSEDPGSLRAHMERFGDSVIVVADGGLTKVHLHTKDPAEVRGWLTERGTVVHEKIDDIDAQHRDYAATRASAPRGEVAVVAVSSGEGLDSLFRSLGVAEIVPGGQTMNPSARQIMEAVEATGSDKVIVLPNNGNIVSTAEQVAAMAEGIDVRVLGTGDMPQGIAAMMSHNYEAGIDDDIEAMKRGRDCVRTGEITLAVRDASIGGKEVRRGQAIGLCQGELLVVEEDVDSALLGLLRCHGVDAGASICIYYGEPVTQQQAAHAEALAQEAFPDADIEAIPGGQLHYHYLVSIE